MKRAFGYVLMFVTISLLLGQDLNAQIEEIDETYNTNIKETTENTIVNVLQVFFGSDVEIVENEK